MKDVATTDPQRQELERLVTTLHDSPGLLSDADIDALGRFQPDFARLARDLRQKALSDNPNSRRDHIEPQEAAARREVVGAGGASASPGDIFERYCKAFNDAVLLRGVASGEERTEAIRVLSEALTRLHERRTPPIQLMVPVVTWLRNMNARNIERNDKIAALEARCAALEADGARVEEGHTVSRYRGTFDTGRSYEPGDSITHAGSLWLCINATSTRPGDDDAAGKCWVLAVKRGKDGRDGAGLDRLERLEGEVRQLRELLGRRRG